MTEKCIMCDSPADWIRVTQFAGEHPFCNDHARQEDDFDVNDSYEFWVEVNPTSWDNWKPNREIR